MKEGGIRWWNPVPSWFPGIDVLLREFEISGKWPIKKRGVKVLYPTDWFEELARWTLLRRAECKQSKVYTYSFIWYWQKDHKQSKSAFSFSWESSGKVRLHHYTEGRKRSYNSTERIILFAIIIRAELKHAILQFGQSVVWKHACVWKVIFQPLVE